MVYLKISDGQETRKFQVNPGEVTFDQLKEQLSTLFPASLNGKSELSLKYRDSDGDVITLSSDQELQEALAELPSETVWKLHIGKASPTRPQTTRAHSPPRCHHEGSLLDLFETRRRPLGLFSDFWQDQFRELEELAQLVWAPHETEATQNKQTSANSETEEAEKSTNSEEAKNATSDEKSEEKQGDVEEAVKSKNADTTTPAVGTPQLHYKTYVSLEPHVYNTLFGQRTVFRPVRYHVWSGSNSWKSTKAEPETTNTEEKDQVDSQPDPPTQPEAEATNTVKIKKLTLI